MSKTRRPPELLRKSHAHVDTDERARARRELHDALEDLEQDDDGPDDSGPDTADTADTADAADAADGDDAGEAPDDGHR